MEPIDVITFFQTQRNKLCIGIMDMPDCTVGYTATPYTNTWHLKFDKPIIIDDQRVRTVNVGSNDCRADIRFRWKGNDSKPPVPDEKTGTVLRWDGRIYYSRTDEKGYRVCQSGTGGVWKSGANGIYPRNEVRNE